MNESTPLESIISYRTYLNDVCDFFEFTEIQYRLENLKITNCIEELDKIYEEIIDEGTEYLVKNPDKLEAFKELFVKPGSKLTRLNLKQFTRPQNDRDHSN